MKTTIKTSKLAEILDICSRFVWRNSTLPILENIYIKWWIDNLIFRASDMEKHIELEIPANIDTEWHITINAAKLTAYVKTIEDEDIMIIVDTSKNTMSIKSSTDNVKFNWLSGNDYLWLPTVQNETTISVDTAQLVKWLGKVDFAINEKNFSPVLTGLLFRIKTYWNDKKLVFVWTDGLRLAEYKIPYFGDAKDFSLIIPKSNIWEVKKVLDYINMIWWESINIRSSDNLVSVFYESENIKINLVSLLIQWNFPEYENENIMPTSFTTNIILNKTATDKAIKKINILTKETNNFISMDFVGDQVIFGSGEMDSGEAIINVPAQQTWPNYKIWLNGKSITDLVKFIDSNDLSIGIVTPEKPIVFLDRDDVNYKYVTRTINV